MPSSPPAPVPIPFPITMIIIITRTTQPKTLQHIPQRPPANQQFLKFVHEIIFSPFRQRAPPLIETRGKVDCRVGFGRGGSAGFVVASSITATAFSSVGLAIFAVVAVGVVRRVVLGGRAGSLTMFSARLLRWGGGVGCYGVGVETDGFGDGGWLRCCSSF